MNITDKIDKLLFEVWYKSPLGKVRRTAAFHFRYEAEAYIIGQKKAENYYIKEVEA